MDGALDQEKRASAVTEMAATELDVLVIGGGVVGAGSALDAVTRGLSVGLIEMQDWASGSSSRSSMLVNGGLRYVDTLELGRLRAGVRERALLFDRIAPHLIQRVPFLFPLRHSGWERAYVGAGLTVYDALGHSISPALALPSHRHLSRRAVRRVAPGLRPDVTGAVQYYGAQVDDARYVITLVRTAASYGALVASRVQADALIFEGDRVVGVRATDLESGLTHEIRARVVVGAAGVWTARLAPGTGVQRPSGVLSHKGVHLVVPRDRIRSSTGIISKTRSSVLLIIPWGRHWIIGTTSTTWTLDLKRPAASATDIDALLDRANDLLGVPLSRTDVQGCYAGLWPQLADRSGGDVHDHRVTTPVAGLVLVMGGTFSKYRLMAADAVDAAARSIGGLIAESITDQVPLLGADGYHARWNQRHLLARRAGLHVARAEHLLKRYGAQVDQLLDLLVAEPSLRAPIPGAEDYLAVELVYAVTHEGAIHLTDLLSRRTRVNIETWDRGVSAAPYAAALVADLLGWSETQTNRELGIYLDRIEAERISQTKRDDWAASLELDEVEDEHPVPSG